MPSYQASREFTELMPTLDSVVDWIQKNLSPDDVFPESALTGYVASTFTPASVFSEKELAEWAENNGFVRKERVE